MNGAETIITQLVTSLGPVGVLAWYCWYVTSRTLPELTAEFREEAAAAREEARLERVHMDEVVRRMCDAQDTRTEKLAQSLDAMVDHCRRVQGLPTDEG